jgi:hypothetical protein
MLASRETLPLKPVANITDTKNNTPVGEMDYRWAVPDFKQPLDRPG